MGTDGDFADVDDLPKSRSSKLCGGGPGSVRLGFMRNRILETGSATLGRPRITSRCKPRRPEKKGTML